MNIFSAKKIRRKQTKNIKSYHTNNIIVEAKVTSMSQFKKLSMENFACYKNLNEVNSPTSERILLIEGGNGSGKTSILNALEFALSGAIESKVPLSEYVNKSGKENEFIVKILIDVDNEEYEITRKYDAGSITLSICNTNTKALLSSDETTTLLQQLGGEKYSSREYQAISVGDTMFADVSVIHSPEILNSVLSELQTRSKQLVILGYDIELDITAKYEIEKTVDGSFLRMK